MERMDNRNSVKRQKLTVKQTVVVFLNNLTSPIIENRRKTLINLVTKDKIINDQIWYKQLVSGIIPLDKITNSQPKLFWMSVALNSQKTLTKTCCFEKVWRILRRRLICFSNKAVLLSPNSSIKIWMFQFNRYAFKRLVLHNHSLFKVRKTNNSKIQPKVCWVLKESNHTIPGIRYKLLMRTVLLIGQPDSLSKVTLYL